MIDNMFGEVDKLKLGLDASWKRSEVIAGNIANNDTPGYNRASVAFEDYFRAALEQESGEAFSMKQTREKHFAGTVDTEPRMEVQVDEQTSMRMDDNNVDIEKEMTDLATNTLYYYTLQSKVSSEFTQLRTAITGG
ncbi:MAG: flagellar basal body rod protein FlgB [Candidatus Pelethousia sp.]|nr:flagellar basal body rod protein FlgB [Candidatus Pelethousia sp.]